MSVVGSVRGLMMGLGMEVWDMALGRVGRTRVGRAEVLVVLLVVRFGAFVFHVSVGLCLGLVSVALGPVVVWLWGSPKIRSQRGV